MSALQFFDKELASPVCAWEGCVHRGRWKILLAGYALYADGPFNELEGYCGKHRNALIAAYESALDGEEVEAA